MKKKSQMMDKDKAERVDANVADWHDMLKWIGKDQQLDSIISNLAKELKSSGANVAQLGDEIEKYCMEEDEQGIGWGADLRSVDWNRLAQWYWDGVQSKRASYSHSFTQEFYGNVDDAKPSQTPTTVADAIASLSEDELGDIRDEFFPTARKDLPKDILWQAILDMIIETNTVGSLDSPVDVWIDPDGYHTVLVFDPIDKDAKMEKKSGFEDDDSVAQELIDYGYNTSEIYNRRFIPIIKNLYRKVKKGTYNPALAIKLWMYWVEDAAKGYIREFADPKTDKWFEMFPKDVRQLAAKKISEQEYEKIQSGEYDNMFAKKETKEEPEVKEAAMKKKSYDREHLLRDVRLDKGYRLKLYETGRTSDRGTEYLAYEFFDPKGKVLFSGADFQHSPMDAIDSDETVRGLLGFLTLRPGDTDDEYFKDYTKEQLEFADTDAEELQLYGLEPEEGEEPYLFDDVNEDEEIEKESSLKKQAGDETWVVGLWIDNDQGLYGQIQEMAADAISSADGDKMTAVNQLRDELQALVEEMNPAKDEASMFSDLMNHALGRVDWRSIAEEKIDEILENKDEPKLPNGERI